MMEARGWLAVRGLSAMIQGAYKDQTIRYDKREKSQIIANQDS